MVCDYFWPSVGGVEMHIWSLAQCLMRQGHKVVVLTHALGGRHGVRYMTNGLKVYYLPWLSVFQNCSLPTVFPMLPLFRNICVRERIEVVHGHQDSSAMVHEALFHAQTLGLHTCFTSHSLFNLYDNGSINLNKVLRFTLHGVDHCIAVSHTCKENLVVRCKLSPGSVSTIPNAVDAASFTPGPDLRDPPPSVTIVILNRLAYRKGADLVAKLIPVVCARLKQVRFVVGGDGPKRLLLDEMVERYQLHDRVELLGSVPHTDVRSVLCRGSIFLNCSLTEAFCMAIVEAACCGLHVVSTRVGGIPEVLPNDMITFASQPSVAALVEAVEKVVQRLDTLQDPAQVHARVRTMYNWDDIALRVSVVYDRVLERPVSAWKSRLESCCAAGPIAAIGFFILVVLDSMLLQLCCALHPNTTIEAAEDIVFERMSSDKGTHPSCSIEQSEHHDN